MQITLPLQSTGHRHVNLINVQVHLTGRDDSHSRPGISEFPPYNQRLTVRVMDAVTGRS